MKFISFFSKNLEHDNSRQKSTSTTTTTTISTTNSSIISFLFHSIVTHARSFYVHVCYFFVVTMLGYLALKLTKPRNDYIPDDFDLFFTSASATTVASLSTIEMEVFSNTQLIIITILIFLGNEIFISLLALQFRRFKLVSSSQQHNYYHGNLSRVDQEQCIELGEISNNSFVSGHDETKLQHNSIRFLGYVVIGYLVVGHVLGTTLVSIYVNLTTSAKMVIENKGLVLATFSIFTTVSTIANCGFIPTNENMIVFKNNPGLLLILIPLGLVGETLYPPCLRFVIRGLESLTKRKEYTYMLKNYQKLDYYGHLMSRKECWYLVVTVFGFWMIQFVMFCAMEWSSGVMEGMNTYEKVVGSLFQTANTRHAGESVVDLSVVSSAILVIFIVMMYFPPYTSFLPIEYQQQQKSSKSYNENSCKKKTTYIQTIIFSQLSYITIFVIVLCITERKNLKEDPLNFNLLKIVFEVISGYGSVGFSTGYSCKRRLIQDKICTDKTYGLTGRFSKAGKFIIILVMFYGRLKKFNMNGGKAWRLS